MRFMEIRQHMPDISQKMLATTLRTLEEDGLLSRTIYPEIPPRVEYALTARAKSLKPALDALLEWSIENMDGIMHDRMDACATKVKANNN